MPCEETTRQVVSGVTSFLLSRVTRGCGKWFVLLSPGCTLSAPRPLIIVKLRAGGDNLCKVSRAGLSLESSQIAVRSACGEAMWKSDAIMSNRGEWNSKVRIGGRVSEISVGILIVGKSVITGGQYHLAIVIITKSTVIKVYIWFES